MDAERRRDADAHTGVARARRAGELRHVARRMSPRPEEVGHDHDLARARRDARCDRGWNSRRHDREVRRRDPPARQTAAKRRRNGGELPVRRGFAAAVVIATLGVANRHDVRLVLDPFEPKNPLLYVDLPFWLYLFAILIVGVLLGGFSVWLGQGKWRRMVRSRTQEALRWKGEAERLQRERDAQVASARADQKAEPRKQLALAGR